MDYIESGSTIITTNSYATQPNYYVGAYGKDYEQTMLEHAKVSWKKISAESSGNICQTLGIT